VEQGAGVHIVDLEGDLVVPTLKDEQDDPIANFEFLQLVVLQHKNKVVGRNVPDPEGRLFRVHGHDLLIQIVKLNKVRVL
jgi:hypothetical protein